MFCVLSAYRAPWDRVPEGHDCPDSVGPSCNDRDMDLNMSGTVEVTLDNGETVIYANVAWVEVVDGELFLYRDKLHYGSFGPGVWEQVIPVGP